MLPGLPLMALHARGWQDSDPSSSLEGLHCGDLARGLRGVKSRPHVRRFQAGAKPQSPARTRPEARSASAVFIRRQEASRSP